MVLNVIPVKLFYREILSAVRIGLPRKVAAVMQHQFATIYIKELPVFLCSASQGRQR